MITCIPDSSFVKRLKSIDRDLDAAFNARALRWEISHRDKHGRVYKVLRVQDFQKGYLPLDGRVITYLRRTNQNRTRTPGEILCELDRHNDLADACRQKDFSNFVRAVAMDERKKMMGLTPGINIPMEI